MKKTVTIAYMDYNGYRFSKAFTGTQEETDAEVERMREQVGIKDAWVE